MVIKGLTASGQGLNSGKNEDSTEPGLIVSGILVPYDWTLPIAPEDSDVTIVANLQAALVALLTNAAYNSRGHYVGPFETFTDNSEATQYQTLGYGKKVLSKRRILTKQYQIIEGGVQYWRSLQSLNGKVTKYKWVEIDNNGVFCGTQKLDSTTGLVSGIQGYRMTDFQAEDRVQANSGAVEGRMVTVTLQNSAEANESLFCIETGPDLDGFVSDLGVQDVTFQAVGLMVAHVGKFRVTAGDGGIDLTQTLPGMLIAANIVAYNDATGAAVTIASVAIVGNQLAITFTTGSGGWSAGVKVRVGLAPVATLATAGYKYYECASLQAMGYQVMVA